MPGTGISCIWTNPLDCGKPLVSGAVSAGVPAAWDAICKSFVTAASGLLQSFAKAFVNIPVVDPNAMGISNAYAASLGIGALAATLLMFGQVIRTAWTHDGNALAVGVSGLAKAVLAWLATAAVASAALTASNTLTRWVVGETFGSQQAFAVRLGNIVNWGLVTGAGGQAAIGASLALVIALIGIVLLIVLWFEMLLRNAALAVLLAISPISAAGQMSEATKVWWQRLVSACIQLIILPVVIALVFSAGFSMASKSHGFEGVLAGLLTLGLAVFAWPIIARFFTFATIQATSSGLATALGFAAGRFTGGNGGGGGPAGVSPDQWSQAAERQTMTSRPGTSGASGEDGLTGPGTGGVPGGAAGGGATGGGVPGGTGSPAGGGAVAAAVVGTVLSALHRAGQMAASGMEQTASHAGMHGAYPYSTVGGGQRVGPSRSRRGPQANSAPPADARTEDTVPAHTMTDDAAPGAPGEPADSGSTDAGTPPARRPDFRPPDYGDAELGQPDRPPASDGGVPADGQEAPQQPPADRPEPPFNPSPGAWNDGAPDDFSDDTPAPEEGQP